jgi:anhydro-N-acetylmuramic acid kinase
MIQRLNEIADKRKKRVIGLMSGTSADGIDAALVEISGYYLDTDVKLLGFITYPFPENIRQRIFRLFSSDCPVTDVCEMNFALGQIFAEAALAVIDHVGLDTSQVDMIGSHGQTICHLPDGLISSTLQIGEPAVIAYRTGILTVADFRVADVAAGGQGAPLVPYVDFLLLRDRNKSRAIQNIGGIGNVTVLPAGGSPDDVLAFDTGPGNMVIDEIVRLVSDGRKNYDREGEMASNGTPNAELLEKMLSHPFIRRVPPKTTGREDFGAHFARDLFSKAKSLGISDSDLVATATACTVNCIYENYKRFILPKFKLSEILVSGGGLHNLTLMSLLRQKFYPIPVKSVEDYGLMSDAKEAIAFAVLANETLHGNAGNIPSATGADRRVILGKIAV